MVKKLKINVLDYVDVGSCKTFTSIEAYNSYNTLKMVLGRKFRGLALDRLSIYFVDESGENISICNAEDFHKYKETKIAEIFARQNAFRVPKCRCMRSTSIAATASATAPTTTNTTAPPSGDNEETHLLLLNYDCLEVLLRRYFDIGDLVEIASTCTYLQQLAGEIFRKKFRQINHSNEILNWAEEKVERYFQHFGAYYESFDLVPFHKFPNTMLCMLARHCGKLVSLRGYQWGDIHFFHWNEIYPKLVHFEYTRHLNQEDVALTVERSTKDNNNALVQKRWPNLQHLKLDSVDIQREDMAKFFEQNSQLKRLEIINTPRICSPSDAKPHCSGFGMEHLINLEEFSYKANRKDYSSYDCFEKLTKLKKLRLYIVDNDKSIMRDILKALLKAKPPLQTLWLICNDYNYYGDREIVELICQFKSIQQLMLKRCVLNGHLFEIMTELPRVNSICCEFQKITVQDAYRALANENRLNIAGFGAVTWFGNLMEMAAKKQNMRIELFMIWKDGEAIDDVPVYDETNTNFTAGIRYHREYTESDAIKLEKMWDSRSLAVKFARQKDDPSQLNYDNFSEPF